MAPLFWLTVQTGKWRIPIPVVLLVPFALVLDTLTLIVLSVYGVWKRAAYFVQIGAGFHLSRLTVAFLLYGGRFRVGIQDENTTLRIFGGWSY